MTIVCGTDLSAAAAEATEVAARLGAQAGRRLILVHAIDQLGAEHALARNEPQLDPVRRELDAEAERLRGFGAAVEVVIEGHEAARTLISVAREHRATLIVVAPVGRHGYGRRLLGSTAARLVSRSPVPVLAVRAAEPFRAWLGGDRALRATVGVDASAAAAAAVRWVEEIRLVAPCDVSAVHVASPIEAQRRLGLSGPMDLDELSDEMRTVLRRELAERVGTLRGGGDVDLIVRHGLGRVDADLADAAERCRADLVVVGSHQWSGLERLLRGSVSRAVVESAAMSVACVPADSDGSGHRVGPVDTVMIATDLSELGAAAVPHGYALLDGSGTVHLLTVTRDEADRDEVVRRLEAAVPSDAAARGIRTVVHVERHDDAADAICAAAERLGADVVCIGTHGRTGLTEVLMGSVAGKVLRGTRRPVLMVRPGA